MNKLKYVGKVDNDITAFETLIYIYTLNVLNKNEVFDRHCLSKVN